MIEIEMLIETSRRDWRAELRQAAVAAVWVVAIGALLWSGLGGF